MSLFSIPDLEQIVLTLVAHDRELASKVDASNLSPEARDVMAWLWAAGNRLDPMEFDGNARALAQSLVEGGQVVQIVGQKNAMFWIRKLARTQAVEQAKRRARL